MTKKRNHTNDRIAAAKDFLLQSFSTACLAHRLNGAEAAIVLAQLLVEAGEHPAASALLPAEAPELWSDRTGRKENPVDFVRRVYGPWLDYGLERSHLFSLDRPLYTALGVWMHRHPEDGMPKGNRVRERVSEALAEHCRTGALPSIAPRPRLRFRVRRRVPGLNRQL